MNKKYIGALFLLGIFLLGACNKQLDLRPTDTFNENNAFRTVADIQSGTLEAYGRLSAYLTNIYSSALISDEAKLGADNAGQGALTYRLQFSADELTGADVINGYGAYYALIDQTNRVLRAIPTISITTDAEATRLDQLRGQLLGLRGLAHFELLKGYSRNYTGADLGIPVMLLSDVTAQPARNTQIEVINQVEADLNEAYNLVGTTSFSDTVLNLINIDAYRARVALYKADYQNAINYSTAVINSNAKPLTSGTDFANIWTDANTQETLLRRRYAANTDLGGLWTTTGGAIYIAPSNKLINEFSTTDIRRSAYFGTNSNGNTFVNKYYNSQRGGRAVDLKLIRIAEMYLIRAEANARLSTANIDAAAADLNFLRSNRISNYNNVSYSSVASLLNDIILERYKELAFEGHRYNDLKRNNLGLQRDPSDAVGSWLSLPADDYRFVLPIPQSELLANPNMVQNNGY